MSHDVTPAEPGVHREQRLRTSVHEPLPSHVHLAGGFSAERFKSISESPHGPLTFN